MKTFYCPFCERDIEPEIDMISEYESAYVYCHDEVEHDDDYDYGELH